MTGSGPFGTAPRPDPPDGFVPFDRFMEWALYDPRDGFYQAARPRLGPAGDFVTAVHATPLYGACLGRYVRRRLEAMADSAPLRLVEIGPGDGRLAAAILTELGRRPLHARLASYDLVERSDARARESYATARRAVGPPGTEIRRVAGPGTDGPLRGIVLAHEVLDAAPCRRFRRTETGWEELGVRADGGRWREVARPIAAPPLPPGGEVAIEPGAIVERAPAAAGLVRAIADRLQGGRAIVVDYGMDEMELLRGHPGGTLAAVGAHRDLPPEPSLGGSVDWSAFVNFDRVRRAIRDSGLTVWSDRPLRDALESWGLPELLAEEERNGQGGSEERVRRRLAVKRLLFGFERFRALEFGPGPAALM